MIFPRSFRPISPLASTVAIMLASGLSTPSLALLGTPSFSRQHRQMQQQSFLSSSSSSESAAAADTSKDKLLVLGGTGFLGQTICKRATLEGYSVTSLSRRGLPSPETPAAAHVDYRMGDARQKDSISNLLEEGGYVGVIHVVGLLLDDASGLGDWNRFASGSGSVPDGGSTYDSITRLTAFNAMEATMDYVQRSKLDLGFPFVFMSAAEAGWPDVPGGAQVERFLAPDWLKRYLAAKRTVETKLLEECAPTLRPIVPRASLIYSLDKPASYLPVGAFFVGNRIGLPFVDRPVTVQSLANAIVRSIGRESVQGVLRYEQIDALNE